MRGPKNARIYADAVSARAEPTPAPDSTSTAASDQNFSPNPFPNQAGKQQVYVLRDGFGGWQGLYRVSVLFYID
jgi:hypothetical protein